MPESNQSQADTYTPVHLWAARERDMHTYGCSGIAAELTHDRSGYRQFQTNATHSNMPFKFILEDGKIRIIG
ncbi:unnamed protein product [Gongylonema pulchrum]|uniref:Rieske domain-containing protein n=1 Tax=Gongylonema pulchrum TaxID=637853 RepID=A0A183EFF5_9BILA|nr:unnamed protein product [Gongylonema pulchrum]